MQFLTKCNKKSRSQWKKNKKKFQISDFLDKNSGFPIQLKKQSLIDELPEQVIMTARSEDDYVVVYQNES